MMEIDAEAAHALDSIRRIGDVTALIFLAGVGCKGGQHSGFDFLAGERARIEGQKFALHANTSRRFGDEHEVAAAAGHDLLQPTIKLESLSGPYFRVNDLDAGGISFICHGPYFDAKSSSKQPR